MACGSNVQTRPDAARSAEVDAHRSALLLVATAQPGAASTVGTASAVVLPERGAITASSTSSQDAASSGPDGSSRPSAIPRSAAPTALAGVPPRDRGSRTRILPTA